MGPVRGMLVDVGITEQQWRVLRVLQEEGPLEPTRIAETACLLLPSLTRILQKLEEKGLIHRRRDPDDKRKQIIVVTAEGRALIDANLDRARALNERVRDAMGAERHDALLDLLNMLHELDFDDPA